MVWNDGFVFTVISEVDTQFDGRGHIGVEFGKSGYKKNRRWYNGRTAEEMNSTYHLQKSGIQKLYPIVAQEIQADTLASRGVETMQKGEVITMANIKTALKKQGMEDFKFEAGDAIISRRGWKKHYGDPTTFNIGCPGIGKEVARRITKDVQAGVTGGDT